MPPLPPNKTTYDDEARQGLLRGVDILANAVKSTLGPRGRNVIIKRRFAQPITTKDGVTVARAISVKDELESAGAEMVREVAAKTSDTAGDGTTSSVVLAQAIYREGVKNVTAGAAPIEIKRGIELATRAAIEHIASIAIRIDSDHEAIKHVATISTHGDTEVGELIALAMSKVGKDGVITVEEGRGLETTLDVVEGMQFARGALSPYFVTDPERGEVVLDNPRVLLVDRQIGNHAELLPIMERAALQNQALLVIAEDVIGEALVMMVGNKLNGAIRCCAVRSPGFGDRGRAQLEDLAELTGGVLVSEELGITLEDLRLDQLGQIKRAVIDHETTTLVAEGGDEVRTRVAARVALIRREIASSRSDYDKQKLEERLARLASGIARVHVGGATETAIREKKDLVKNAVNSTRAAVQEGIVPGGGVALIRASEQLSPKSGWLSNLQFSVSGDARIGINILAKALEAPFRTIVENAGGKPDVLLEQVIQHGGNYGWDGATEELVDMIARGIIDPAKVVKQALQNAASIAGLLLETQVVVTELPEDEWPGGRGANNPGAGRRNR